MPVNTSKPFKKDQEVALDTPVTQAPDVLNTNIEATTLNASDLGTTAPQVPSQSFDANPTIDGLIQSVQTSQARSQSAKAPIKQQLTSFEQQLQNNLDRLAGRGQATIAAEAGLNNFEDDISELDSIIADRSTALERNRLRDEEYINNIGVQPGVDSAIITGQQAITRQNRDLARQSEAASIALQQTKRNIMSNDLLRAKEDINRVLDLTYGDSETKAQNALLMIDRLDGKLSAEESKELAESKKIYDLQLAKIDEDKATKKSVANLAIEARKNGADGATVDAILSSETEEDAIANAGQFLRDPDAGLAREKFEYGKGQDSLDRDYQNTQLKIDAAKNGLQFDSATGGLSYIQDSTDYTDLLSIMGSADIPDGQKNQIGAANDVVTALEDWALNNGDGKFVGLGVAGAVKEGIKGIFNAKNPDAIVNEQNLEALNLKIQQWASGASLTDEQTKQVERLAPSKSDSDKNIRVKMNGLIDYMNGVIKSRLEVNGIPYDPPPSDLFGEKFEEMSSRLSPEQQAELKQTVTDPKDIVSMAAQATGFEAPYMLAMAERESGFNPTITNPASSASGMFQFLDGTWNESVNKYGSKYGITQADRNTPGAQALLAAEYGKENARLVQQNTGRTLQGGEHYIPHFLGAGGASTLLNNLGSQSAASLLPQAANANKNVFYRNGKPLTTQQLYDSLVGDMNRRAAKYA